MTNELLPAPLLGEVSCPHGVFEGHCFDCDGPLVCESGDLVPWRWLVEVAKGRLRTRLTNDGKLELRRA